MIIVSQDRKTIVNFNAIETIQIDDNVLDKTEAEFEIFTDGEALGYYKTEERAKEVLVEIARTFSAALLNGKYDEIDLILKAKNVAIYEMPQK